MWNINLNYVFELKPIIRKHQTSRYCTRLWFTHPSEIRNEDWSWYSIGFLILFYKMLHITFCKDVQPRKYSHPLHSHWLVYHINSKKNYTNFKAFPRHSEGDTLLWNKTWINVKRKLLQLQEIINYGNKNEYYFQSFRDTLAIF